jgi:Spx/MgsR family transcriptional regulator
MTRIYGIQNCDTVKRARAWLAEHGLAAEFHDFGKQGIAAERLAAWVAECGWERVLNRRGTTWRRLTEDERAAVVDADSAIAAMLQRPSLIKRPVVEWDDGRVSIGFEPGKAPWVVAAV